MDVPVAYVEEGRKGTETLPIAHKIIDFSVIF